MGAEAARLLPGTEHWDLKSGKEIAIFTGDGPIVSSAIARDGRTIVAGESSGRVHFLQLVEADETKPANDDTKIQLLQRQEQARSTTDS
jgi:hypothetical protein